MRWLEWIESQIYFAAGDGGNRTEKLFQGRCINGIGVVERCGAAGGRDENGFQANDPWYSPPSTALQRQFLIDLQNVEKGLPNNLGTGIGYWNAAGVNIPKPSGGFFNGGNQPDAIYIWNVLTLFDNAESSGTTNVSASNYSTPLPGLDALGGH